MGADQQGRMRARTLSDSRKLQSLQGAEPLDAACRSELDTFDQLVGQRSKKEIRAKAAAICNRCVLRSRCGFRVVPLKRKRDKMSEVSARVEKFIAAWKARDEQIAHLTEGMEAKPSTIVDVIVTGEGTDDEIEYPLLFSDLEDMFRAYSLVTQVRAKEDIPSSSDTAPSGS